jgi:HK97 family phage major capsid protein
VTKYSAAVEEIKGLVTELTSSVEAYRRNSVDRSTVEAIVTDLLSKQKGAAAIAARRSYTPEDSPRASALEATLSERAREIPSLQGHKQLERILELPSPQVSAVLHRSEDDIELFKEASDKLLLTAAIMDKPPHTLDFFEDSFRPTINAAVGTGAAGAGADYVPTILSSQLVERVNLRLMIANLFQQVEMPTNPFELPGVALARQPVPSAAEQTGDPGPTAIVKLTLATRKVILTAKKIAAMALVSKELEEDAVLLTLDWMQQEMIDYTAGQIEDAIVNGDTAGTHEDSDVTAADDARKLYNGLRKIGLTNGADGGNAALTVALLRANRGRMGKYGVDPAKLAHVVSPINAVQLMNDTAVLTMEKYGPHATILVGEIARVDNIPVVLSEYARTDLNATGVHDGVTTNRSVALTVFTNGFVVGTRRSIQLEILRELYSEYDQDAVKISTRKAFAERYPDATEKIVAAIHNLSIT